MEVQESYDLPFSSAFDWRSGMFETINDLTHQAMIEVLKEYKEDFTDVEWKDQYGLVDLAFREKIFEKIHSLVLKKAEDID